MLSDTAEDVILIH